MLADYTTINMLHLLITNSVDEIHKVLEIHTQFLPDMDKLKTTNKQDTVERPKGAPQVRI